MATEIQARTVRRMVERNDSGNIVKTGTTVVSF